MKLGSRMVPDAQNVWCTMSPNDTTDSVGKTGNLYFPELPLCTLCVSAPLHDVSKETPAPAKGSNTIPLDFSGLIG